MTEAAGDERFEQAAQLRDAIRTIETLHTRQQKMAGAELGDRDAFGLKLGPAGAVVQVFQMRGGRVDRARSSWPRSWARRVDAGPRARRRSATAANATCCRRRLQQFYADRPAPPEIHLPIAFSDADTEMLEGWLSGDSRAPRPPLVPKRGEKRGLLDLAARNAAVAYQARFNENVAAHYDALETLRSRPRASGGAAPHRVLRHLDDPGQPRPSRRWSSAKTAG